MRRCELVVDILYELVCCLVFLTILLGKVKFSNKMGLETGFISINQRIVTVGPQGSMIVQHRMVKIIP